MPPVWVPVCCRSQLPVSCRSRASAGGRARRVCPRPGHSKTSTVSVLKRLTADAKLCRPPRAIAPPRAPQATPIHDEDASPALTVYIVPSRLRTHTGRVSPLLTAVGSGGTSRAERLGVHPSATSGLDFGIRRPNLFEEVGQEQENGSRTARGELCRVDDWDI